MPVILFFFARLLDS